MLLRRLILLAASAAVLTLAAQASSISYNFNGRLSATDPGGDAYGTFTLDGSAVTSFVFAIGGHTFSNASLFPSATDGVDDAGNPLLDFSYVADSQGFNFYLDFGPSGFPGAVNTSPFLSSGFTQQSGLFAIGSFTNSPVDIALYSGSVSEVVATPEPASGVLTLSGVLLLGALAWKERRRLAVA